MNDLEIERGILWVMGLYSMIGFLIGFEAGEIWNHHKEKKEPNCEKKHKPGSKC